MNDKFSLNTVERPKVLLFAEPEGLAINIVENLLANFCCVNVITENVPAWKIISLPLRDNINFIIESNQENLKNIKIDYLIFESIFFSNVTYNESLIYAKEEQRFKQTLKYLSHPNIKVIFLLPNLFLKKDLIFLKTLIQKYFVKTPQNVEIVFIDYSLGPRMLLTERFLTTRFLTEVILNKDLMVPSKDIILKPLPTGDLVKNIIKNLFLFNYPGQKIIISGKPVSLENYLLLIKQNKDFHKIIQVNEDWIYEDGFDKEIIVNGIDLEKAIKSTLEWFSKNRPEYLIENSFNDAPPVLKDRDFLLKKTTQPSSIPPVQADHPRHKRRFFEYYSKTITSNMKNETKKISPKIEEFYINKSVLIKQPKPVQKFKEKKPHNDCKKFLNKSILKTILISILIMMISPLILFIYSLLSIYISEKILIKTNTTITRYVLLSTLFSSKTAKTLFNYYSQVVKNDTIKEVKNYSSLINKQASVLIDLTEIIDKSSKLTEKIFANEPYDLNNLCKNLSLDLNSLYRQISFLEGETKDIKKINIVVYEKLLPEFNLSEKKEEIAKIKVLIDNLPDVLGEKYLKTYLILFQNEMELRPTGGSINSIALVKFDKGRLVDINLMNTDSADAQLKGLVEPPEEIKLYLGKTNWSFKDSNWNPDFPSSAQKAEWFLDKEMGESVDGVIAVDLQFIQNLIEILGNIEIEEFNKTINKDNLYEISKTELEKDLNLKAGNKANFLMNLINVITDKTFLAFDKKSTLFLKASYQNLNTRHLQVFLHNNEFQKAISDLNWDGSMNFSICKRNNCYADWLSIIESNLGNNLANFFIERQTQLTSTIDKDKIKRTLTINLKSNSNPALGYQGQYKTYLRIYVPGNSVFQNTKIESQKESKVFSPNIRNIKGFTEAGIFVDIEPNQEKNITFQWESKNSLNLNNNGEYQFSFRKQAGIKEQKLKVIFEFPKDINFESIEPFSLTSMNKIEYNYISSRDVISRISFKK